VLSVKLIFRLPLGRISENWVKRGDKFFNDDENGIFRRTVVFCLIDALNTNPPDFSGQAAFKT